MIRLSEHGERMSSRKRPRMAAEPIIYVDGEFVRESQARISVLDHAVLYGDGVFETVCAWNGRIFKLDEHLDRCFRSMAAIALAPPVSRDAMRDLIIEAVRRNGFRNAYVKWIVTRGVNGRPLMDPTGCVANLIILVQPYINRASGERAAAGLRLKTVAVRRPSGDVLDPHIKSLNYLNLVMAKIEAQGRRRRRGAAARPRRPHLRGERLQHLPAARHAPAHAAAQHPARHHARERDGVRAIARLHGRGGRSRALRRLYGRRDHHLQHRGRPAAGRAHRWPRDRRRQARVRPSRAARWPTRR